MSKKNCPKCNPNQHTGCHPRIATLVAKPHTLGGQASHPWWPRLFCIQINLQNNQKRGSNKKTTQTAHKFHSTTHKFLVTTLATQKHFHKTKPTIPTNCFNLQTSITPQPRSDPKEQRGVFPNLNL